MPATGLNLSENGMLLETRGWALDASATELDVQFPARRRRRSAASGAWCAWPAPGQYGVEFAALSSATPSTRVRRFVETAGGH